MTYIVSSGALNSTPTNQPTSRRVRCTWKSGRPVEVLGVPGQERGSVVRALRPSKLVQRRDEVVLVDGIAAGVAHDRPLHRIQRLVEVWRTHSTCRLYPWAGTTKSGARFTKYLTTILRLSYDNAKVTIDLPRTSNLRNILRKTQGFSYVQFTCKIVRSSKIVFVN